MLEYVFFDPVPCDKFVAFLREKNIPFTPPDDDDVLMISVSEDLGDEMSATIEAYYDEMMELGSEILSNQTGDGQINAAGLTVTLSDGRVSYAVLEPAIVNKVLEVLSLDELNSLVNAIADAVENPDQTPLCKRSYD